MTGVDPVASSQVPPVCTVTRSLCPSLHDYIQVLTPVASSQVPPVCNCDALSLPQPSRLYTGVDPVASSQVPPVCTVTRSLCPSLHDYIQVLTQWPPLKFLLSAL